jgi:hypothetical protein
LQSIDAQGKDKVVGGDECVTYSDNVGTPIPPEPKTAALAFITDIQDGTYLLDFVHHT